MQAKDESFGSQSGKCVRFLGIPRPKPNPNGFLFQLENPHEQSFSQFHPQTLTRLLKESSAFASLYPT